jgi:hypothetical protein
LCSPAFNWLPDTPVCIKRVLSFKGHHQQEDAVSLTRLALLRASRFIPEDKRIFIFHVGFLTVAIPHYIQTDYNAESRD